MAGPKTGIRGFGTGKGRTKGTANKITNEVQTLIARIIAGSVDELSLKVLAIDNPELYAELMNSPTVKRVFALKRGGPNSIKRKRPVLKMPQSQEEVDQVLTTIQRIKHQKKMDGMSDTEVVMYDAMANGIPEASIPNYLSFIGPYQVAKKASDLRYSWLEPEQKRERAANIYITVKRGMAERARKKEAR